jgi:HlyD family secretion protein
MHAIRKITALTAVFMLSLGLASCDAIMAEESNGLKASGVVETVEVVVSAEIGGRVAHVLAVEGERISEGDVLLELDDALMNAQLEQAVSAHEAAEANLDSARAGFEAAEASLQAAQAGVDLAEAEYQLERNTARLDDQPARTSDWDRDVPNEFDMPVWYFEKSERIEAAEAELETAQNALEDERENYEKVLEDAGQTDILEAEKRLSEAQAAFLVADDLTDRDVDTQDREEIDDFVDTIYDAAEAELESAQKAYDKLLSDQAAEEILEARARLTVAQERYDTALDLFQALLTGDDSLQVWAAEAALRQAEAVVAQAEANLLQVEASVVQAEKMVAQTQAALDAFQLQMDKLTLRAAVSGVVMTRSVEPGEVIQPGITVMTLGQIENLTITVYIPEDRYGQISLGDSAQVTADSFPEQVFGAVVTRIADQAEYTPRNVQTEEDRRTTVYAVELSVEDPDGKLKPGMPADVVFSVP